MNQIIINSKSLSSLIKDIRSLVSKLIRFNITAPCELLFAYDKTTHEIFPILLHYSQPLHFIRNYCSSKSILENESIVGETSDYLTDIDMIKFVKKFDSDCISHNVIFSTKEIDLSLKRDDWLLYSKSSRILFLPKFQEFLQKDLIKEIRFSLDIANNIFTLDQYILENEENPIIRRQKLNYLYIDDTIQSFFNKDRDQFMSIDLLKLCELSITKTNGETFLLSKEQNNEIELEFKVNNEPVFFSKEFHKAGVKEIDIFTYKEPVKDLFIRNVLLHSEYNTKIHQYLFYRYYDVDIKGGSK